eukprot:s2067_g17.t1
MPVPPGMVNPGTLNTGTTPVYDMSGPGGPPTTYGPAAVTGNTGSDPLQGSGDPWGGAFRQPSQPVNAATLFPGSDGSGLSSSTFQTATGQSGTPSSGGCTIFGDVLLALQGQVADAFARMTSSAPTVTPMGGTPVTPMGGTPVTPMGGTPVTPMGGAPMGMSASAMGTAAAAFPPQPRERPLEVWEPITYVDEALRSNPSYLWCDDGCFRRLL